MESRSSSTGIKKQSRDYITKLVTRLVTRHKETQRDTTGKPIGRNKGSHEKPKLKSNRVQAPINLTPP